MLPHPWIPYRYPQLHPAPFWQLRVSVSLSLIVLVGLRPHWHFGTHVAEPIVLGHETLSRSMLTLRLHLAIELKYEITLH